MMFVWQGSGNGARVTRYSTPRKQESQNKWFRKGSLWLSTFEHWISPKSLIFSSTEVSDKTIKNNVDYSFETFLTLENEIFFQYRSDTVIKNVFESITKGFQLEIIVA